MGSDACAKYVQQLGVEHDSRWRMTVLNKHVAIRLGLPFNSYDVQSKVLTFSADVLLIEFGHVSCRGDGP